MHQQVKNSKFTFVKRKSGQTAPYAIKLARDRLRTVERPLKKTDLEPTVRQELEQLTNRLKALSR